MAVFLRDPTYPEHEEESAQFEQQFLKRLNEAFPDSDILEADAGPSASIPGWMARLTAVGWFIFATPAVIEENFPIWEAAFEGITEIAAEYDAKLSIDVHDATALAFREVAKRFDWSIGKIEIVDIICHWCNLNGVYSHHFNLEEVKEPDEVMIFHEQAIMQYQCRYVLLLRNADWDAATVLVKSDGSVEFCSEL